MFLDERADNLNLGRWLARRVKSFDFAGPQTNMDDEFRTATGQPVNSVFIPSATTNPAAYYGQSGPYTLLLIDNTPGLLAAARLYIGYKAPIIGRQFDQFNGWAEGFKTVLDRAIATGHFTRPANLIIAGHSAGGMCGQVYATQLLQADDRNVAKVVTFGSPKPGMSFMGLLLSEAWSCRWMNSNDAVPLLPASDIRSSVIMAQGNLIDAQNFLRFAHVAGGVELSHLGDATPRELPSAVVDTPWLSIQSWLVSNVTNAESPHSMQEYIRRMDLLDENTNAVAGGDYEGSPMERPLNPPMNLIQQIQVEQAANIFHLGAQQQVNEVVIPDFQAFTVRKEGRLYNVYFGDQRIAIGPTKRRAHGYANRGNDFLRRMQRLGVVDPAAFTEQMQLYLELAALPGQFIPPMNVRVP